jgi:hypothetical protein
MFLRESIAANSPEGKFLFRLRQNKTTCCAMLALLDLME